MEKIPCIKCTPELWEYIKPHLKEWGYKNINNIKTSSFDIFPLLVINHFSQDECCNSETIEAVKYYNRKLVTNVEEFLQRAAALRGFIYKRKDIMEINGIEIKPGMILITEEGFTHITFPTAKGNAFVNISEGTWSFTVPKNIVEITDLAVNSSLYSGKTLWKKSKEVVITMDQIAEKFGYPVEQIKIIK